MDGSRLRLTGIGEGFATQLTTELTGADSPAKVMEALQTLFPDANIADLDPEPMLGEPANAVWTFEDLSLGVFLTQLHEQRILDTALDAMSASLENGTTTFRVSRQAAMAGKVAFPIPGDQPLGGVFTITVSGQGLGDWLQAATWHPGRAQVPRNIDDEHAMGRDGDATTWV